MNTLPSFKFIILLFLRATIVTSQECSPFLNNEFSLEECKFSLSPFYGPEGGGTVVKITSLDYYCPINNESRIFCRFRGNAFTEFFPGATARYNVFQCISPFSGQATDVEVSFTAIPLDCDFDPDTAEWITLNERFQYFGDRSGVVVSGTSLEQESSSPSLPPKLSRKRALQQSLFPVTSPTSSLFPSLIPVENPSTSSLTSLPSSTNSNNDATGPPNLSPILSPTPSPTPFPTTSTTINDPSGPPNLSPILSPTPLPTPFPTASTTINDPSGTPNIPPTEIPTNEATNSSKEKPPAPDALIIAGNPVKVDWSSEALKLSAKPARFLKLKIEVLAYNNTAHFTFDPNFQVIQSTDIFSIDTNSTTLIVEDNNISNFLINDWGIEGESVAIILVRIVAYTIFNEMEEAVNLVRAIRSSKLIGVVPESTKSLSENGLSCPLSSREFCQNDDDLPWCPPSYGVARNDFNYSPDKICAWPSGNSTCDPTIDLYVDNATTCLSNQDQYYEVFEIEEVSDRNDICGVNLEDFNDKVERSDGCGCATFHSGATGCVMNGKAQCCYSGSGALITQIEDGGGTVKCYPSDNTLLDTVGNFLYDILPFNYCCLLNDECESYQEALSIRSDDMYKNPLPAARVFGDPHLTTFDDVDYDFNGFGEYVAFCTLLNDQNATTAKLLEKCNPSTVKRVPNRGMLSVHYRFTTLQPDHRGTATIGVAIEDPLFRNGEHALVVRVNQDRNIRLDLFNGDNLRPETFPSAQIGIVELKIDGAVIRKNANTGRRFFIMTIQLPSGLTVKIVETGGVLLPTISRPVKLSNVIGLLGRPDNNQTNDFTNSSGKVLAFSSGTSQGGRALQTSQVLFNAEQTNDIFVNFGQSWMIKSQNASLFNEDFSDFFRVTYQPWFEAVLSTENPTDKPSPIPTSEPSTIPSSFSSSSFPSSFPTAEPSSISSDIPLVSSSTKFSIQNEQTSDSYNLVRQLQLQNMPTANEVCDYVEDEYIRQSCIFDYAVTGDATLVRGTTDAAVIEEENAAIVSDTAPEINGGRNQSSIVAIDEGYEFEIIVTDTDGDSVVAFLERNDNGLFELSTRGVGVYDLSFNGSEESGIFKAQVTVTDGLIPVLFTGKVNVVSSLPISTPTITPTPKPIRMPTYTPTLVSCKEFKDKKAKSCKSSTKSNHSTKSKSSTRSTRNAKTVKKKKDRKESNSKKSRK